MPVVIEVRGIERVMRQGVWIEGLRIHHMCASFWGVLNGRKAHKRHVPPDVALMSAATKALSREPFSVLGPRQLLGLQQVRNGFGVNILLDIALRAKKRAANHREIIRIRGMKESMKVGKERPLLGELGHDGVLTDWLKILIFEHNNEDMVEYPPCSPGLHRLGETGGESGRGRTSSGHSEKRQEKACYHPT